jgi:hypothetical protein
MPASPGSWKPELLLHALWASHLQHPESAGHRGVQSGGGQPANGKCAGTWKIGQLERNARVSESVDYYQYWSLE